jgi:hypothetical protein
MPLLVHFGIRKRLHKRAILLGLALRMYEDSLCSGCGHSSLLAYGGEGVGEYKRHTIVCAGCEEREREKDKDPLPGVKTYVIDLHDHPRNDDGSPVVLRPAGQGESSTDVGDGHAGDDASPGQVVLERVDQIVTRQLVSDAPLLAGANEHVG